MLVSLLSLAGLYVGYQSYQRTRNVILDKARVEEMAASFLPGAKPLPGCVGVVALDKDMLQAAIFAPSLAKSRPGKLEGSELRILIVQAKKMPDFAESLEKWSDVVGNLTAEPTAAGSETLEKKPEIISAGGRPQPFLRTVKTFEGKPERFVDYTTAFFYPEKVVVLQITGPEAKFNQVAMESFLGDLQVPVREPVRDRLRKR